MAIINIPPQPNVTQICSFLRNNNTQMSNHLVNGVLAGFKAFWMQPDQVNCGPVQIAAALGSDAGPLVTAFSNIATLINSVYVAAGAAAPLPTAYPNGYTLVVNNDNTVTITPPAS